MKLPLLLFSTLTLFRLSPFLSRLQWPAEQSFHLRSPVPLICSPKLVTVCFLKFISNVSFPTEVFSEEPPHLMNKARLFRWPASTYDKGPLPDFLGHVSSLHTWSLLPDCLQLLERLDTVLCWAMCTSFVCHSLLSCPQTSHFLSFSL